MRHKVD
ncbi:uncharacterized protein FFC1_03170 [Fusarium fujikuroi]|nr:uncharacterized protein FFC1_03170 [Fusarium fujikuroi]